MTNLSVLLNFFALVAFNLELTNGQEPSQLSLEPLQRPKFFKYRRQQFDSPIDAGSGGSEREQKRKAIGSVLSSKVVVVKQKGEEDPEGGSGGGQFSTTIKDVNGTSSSFVPTSGVRKLCSDHSDCYGLREPDEWCPLSTKEKYVEKGCYCNSEISFCAIERISNGARQFTDCFNQTTSVCAKGLKIEKEPKEKEPKE